MAKIHLNVNMVLASLLFNLFLNIFAFVVQTPKQEQQSWPAKLVWASKMLDFFIEFKILSFCQGKENQGPFSHFLATRWLNNISTLSSSNHQIQEKTSLRDSKCILVGKLWGSVDSGVAALPRHLWPIVSQHTTSDQCTFGMDEKCLWLNHSNVLDTW